MYKPRSIQNIDQLRHMGLHLLVVDSTLQLQNMEDNIRAIQ